jgi:hypothetical protein
MYELVLQLTVVGHPDNLSFTCKKGKLGLRVAVQS